MECGWSSTRHFHGRMTGNQLSGAKKVRLQVILAMLPMRELQPRPPPTITYSVTSLLLFESDDGQRYNNHHLLLSGGVNLPQARGFWSSGAPRAPVMDTVPSRGNQPCQSGGSAVGRLGITVWGSNQLEQDLVLLNSAFLTAEFPRATNLLV